MRDSTRATGFSVVAIIAAYNEADIIAEVVTDFIAQGVHVYLLDDGSTDGTVAAVEPLVGRGVIAIESIERTGTFAWRKILERKTLLSRQLDADWFIHNDADEFRESPWPHLRLRDAIELVDRLGYTAIDSARFDFLPTGTDAPGGGGSVRDRLTRWRPPAPYDRLQIRCWKKTAADVDLASTGGHDARFEGRRVFPLRFVLRHYPLRGQAHAARKVFDERRPRFLAEERAIGWHVQYDHATTGASLLAEPDTLQDFDGDCIRAQLAIENRRVEELEGALAAAADETARFSQAERALTADIQRLEAELSAARRTLGESQRTSREELDRTRAEMDALRADAQAAALQAERALADAQAAALRAERALDEARDARAGAEARVRAVHESLSWRATAPARAVIDLFRR